MKPKAITFFDLDGTLLNKQSQVDPDVAQAMQTLRKNNILPVIATGRTNPEIIDIAKAAGIDSFITMNGQYVEIAGKEVYSDILDVGVVERMLHFAQSRGDELGFYNHKKIRVTTHTALMKKAYDFIHSDLPEIDPEFFQKEELNMLLVLGTDGDDEYIKNFPELKFFRNGPFSIDTIDKDGSKGHGVRKLLENMNYLDVPTYGFGDGPNDMELLGACKYKIAMGNARDTLKEQADFVTKKNTDGGIVYALRHFDLI
ncbi:Cof-type HAD-IIB family hydrolase [Enterococcus timonensis]|uniref:Cof-type HAD-IIB family hydrolase n=1 Tax=Enterococcus timonensis TaxID=1852364 RepID=UPI0008DABFE4|nr:Cof-type HAD-IIB family hydrolase [Enterococcus timonensis]